ncbi:MAG: hypothetical protein J6Y29_03120 [Clostridiales bacterium]|nr:hypothetical protein [Clostridiales bacterium]
MVLDIFSTSALFMLGKDTSGKNSLLPEKYENNSFRISSKFNVTNRNDIDDFITLIRSDSSGSEVLFDKIRSEKQSILSFI